MLFIKNNLINFVEMYININRNLKNINIKSQIINDIIDDMIKNVFDRSISIKNKEITCIVNNFKTDLKKQNINIQMLHN